MKLLYLYQSLHMVGQDFHNIATWALLVFYNILTTVTSIVD